MKNEDYFKSEEFLKQFNSFQDKLRKLMEEQENSPILFKDKITTPFSKKLNGEIVITK